MMAGWPGGGKLADVRKIAVLRPNAVGDFVFALPALHALKRAYPGAELVLLGLAWHAGFLAGRPGPVDRVIVVPPLAGIGCHPDAADDAVAQAFVGAMRPERFDIVCQMYGGGRYANPLAAAFGARLTVGARAVDAAPLDRWVRYAEPANRRLALLEIAALAGAAELVLGPELTVTRKDRLAAAAVLGEAQRLPGGVPARESVADAVTAAQDVAVAQDGAAAQDLAAPWGRAGAGLQAAAKASAAAPVVLLQPGSTDLRRCWPPDCFAAAGDALAAMGARIVINGTAAEAPRVRAVIAAMRAPALDLSGKLGLGGLCGLIEGAACVLSNDTGPLHLALSIGRPCVGIFWLTNLIDGMPLRQGLLRAALSLRQDCPVCGAPNLHSRCAHDASFVADIPVEQVVRLAADILDGAFDAPP